MKRIVLILLPVVVIVFLFQMISGKELDFNLADFKYWLEYEMEIPNIYMQISHFIRGLEVLNEELVDLIAFKNINNPLDLLKELYELFVGIALYVQLFITINIGSLLLVLYDLVKIIMVPINFIDYFLM